MKQTVSYKNIWLLAYPIIIGSIAENLNNVVNTAFVASLGEVSIGAVGLGGLFYFNFAIIALGLAAGVQIIIGRRNGEMEYEEAGNIFTHGLLLFSTLSVILLSVMYFSTPGLLRIFINSDTIYAACVGYAKIRIFGILFLCLTVCMRSFYIGITKTKIITIITIVSACTNVLFDYLLIFGHGPFHPYGINGAAYASIIAEITAMSGYFLATITLPFVRKYKAFHFRRFDVSNFWNILKTGAPLMLQSWISFSSWLLFFIFIEKMGQRQLAISAIIKNIYLLFMIPLWGFASTSNSFTSNLIGQGQSDQVMKLMKKIVTLSTIVVAIPAIFCFIFPGPMIHIFNQNPELISQTINPLRIVAIALLLFPAAFVLFNGVSGSGDTKTALIIELFTIFFYISYMYFMTRVLRANMTWVWTCEIIYMVLLGSASYFRLQSGKWKGKIV